MELVDKILLALFLPGLSVVLFTRVTYNQIVALILSIALIAASVYAGYSTPPIVFMIDAFSLTVGFWFANKLMKRRKGFSEEE